MSAVEELIDAAGLAYLASPYSHNDPAVRHARFKATERAVAWLTIERIYAVSPIVACHELALQYKLPFDAQFWAPWNGRVFFSCRRLIVLCLDGWEESIGVAQERKWAQARKMFEYAMTETEDGYTLNRIP